MLANMVRISVLAMLYASTATAFKMYGTTPSLEQYGSILKFSEELAQQNMSLVSVLSSPNKHDKDIQDFLTSRGYQNGTMDMVKQQYRTASTSSLNKRAPTTTCNTGSKVELNAAQQTQVCRGLQAAAGGGAATIAYVIQGFTCSAADNGNPTFCNAAFVFLGTAGVIESSGQVDQYCPSLFNSIQSDCGGKGGDAIQDNTELIEQISQNDLSCADETGNCIQTSIA